VKKKVNISIVLPNLLAGGAEWVISTLSNVLIERFDIVIVTFIKSTPFYCLDKKN